MVFGILFYDVVLFVHVTAVILAFGVTFAYPIIGTFVMRNDPRALPVLHRAQALVGKTLISGGLLIALIAGIYLASDRDLWSEIWVTIPFIIIIILGGLGGMFFGPPMPRQEPSVKSMFIASFSVGTSLNCGLRSEAMMASDRALPASSMARASGTEQVTRSMPPAARSCIAGAAPFEGTQAT